MRSPADLLASDFDEPRILERVAGDRALLAELTDLLHEEAPVILHELVSATDASNLQEVERSAHRLRGALANFGAGTAVGVAERIEAAARAGSVDGLADLAASLEPHVNTLLARLDRLNEGVPACES